MCHEVEIKESLTDGNLLRKIIMLSNDLYMRPKAIIILLFDFDQMYNKLQYSQLLMMHVLLNIPLTIYIYA